MVVSYNTSKIPVMELHVAIKPLLAGLPTDYKLKLALICFFDALALSGIGMGRQTSCLLNVRNRSQSTVFAGPEPMYLYWAKRTCTCIPVCFKFSISGLVMCNPIHTVSTFPGESTSLAFTAMQRDICLSTSHISRSAVAKA